jgi:cytochrome P450
VAGYQIPKGTTFTIAPGMINHDTELWGPDAGVFDPERWMREGCTNTGGVRSNYGFLTFLHGPRSCIGATFAKSELACLVAALVGRFRMELEDPDKEEELIKHEIGASPVDGVRTRFEIVDGW